MIWFGFIIVSLVILSPLIWAQGSVALRGRQQAALAFYRAQLSEVGDEVSRGRLGEREQAEARLEIERRLLAAGSIAEDSARAPHRFSWRLAVLVVILPIAALVVYLLQGEPMLPAAPLGPRVAAAEAQVLQDRAMLVMLKAKIATLDPRSEQARQGYILLGNMEGDLGDTAAAADAWRHALTIRYDDKLAQIRAMALQNAETTGHLGVSSLSARNGPD